MDGEMFDFWLEGMEDVGYLVMMERKLVVVAQLASKVGCRAAMKISELKSGLTLTDRCTDLISAKLPLNLRG